MLGSWKNKGEQKSPQGNNCRTTSQLHDFARFSESLVYVSHMEQGECNCLFDIFLAPSSLDAALKVDVDHVSMQQPVVDFSSTTIPCARVI